MAVYSLQKKLLGEFLSSIVAEGELIAPVKTDLVRFEKIADPSKIHFTENAFFPLKEFFFRKHEVMMVFDGHKFVSNFKPPGKRVFFGVRRCDLNAIKRQDMVFLQGAVDPAYAAQREGALFIGYHCNTAPSEYCFCGSMELEDFHDLMFFERGEQYLVQTGSKKGEAFAKKHGRFFKHSAVKISERDKIIPGTKRLKKHDLSKLYDNPAWKKDVAQCLSCGACTTLCPTCYCFEFKEVASLQDEEKSSRVREWSSCQVPDFTRVAGNFVFRQGREERFKHRIYHQLDYFKERNGVNLCVGCGRCISGCPTRIDFVKTINKM